MRLEIFANVVLLIGCAPGISTAADAEASVTFKTLLSFNSANGSYPGLMSLVQGLNGNLYGTVIYGGDLSCTFEASFSGCGTVFSVTPGGRLTTLHRFSGPDGTDPLWGLVQAASGVFYGVTSLGGANGHGTIFKINPSGTLTTLYNFCSQTNCPDGTNPYGALVQGKDGDFYGTAADGGANTVGTVFKITAAGNLTTLHTFASGPNDGAIPTGLVLSADGKFYGTTEYGGTYGNGTFFRISPAGDITILYSFLGADGYNPYAPPVQAADGNFYGTTYFGGNATGNGTVYKITAGGELATLYKFSGPDGASPSALFAGTDGNIYGTTAGGGDQNMGTVFKITPTGMLTTLYSFCPETNCPDGANPYGGLVQDTNGTFYGATERGGTNCHTFGGCGTLFSLSVTLKPFIELLPTSGKVGATVRILGSNLTGATSVGFNDTATVFKVISPTQIVAQVPTNATTGFVTVTLPNGVLKSNTRFHILP